MSEVAQLPVRMDQPATQAAFGAMVGITQQAVSDLQARGVIAVGQPLGVWLTAYCDHLREMAAGRDPDGQLASERTRLAREQADRIAMRNAIDRKDFAPVQLLEEVLANLARQVATQLDAVMPEVRRRFPYLTGEPIRFLEERLALARDAAAAARFSAAELEEDPDDDAGDAG